jgi:nickel/cobalt transporter (NiCoT) family protein
MNPLPTDGPMLCAVVFLLGLKHVFDADHLAAIDGMARLHSGCGRLRARWCGALFSLGHGAVVVLVSLLVSGFSGSWSTPDWLGITGVWLSVSMLLALGVTNLRAVLTASPGVVVNLAGFKGRWFERWLGRWLQAGSPLAVASVGALFALSLDTVSQAAMFAFGALPFGGPAAALALGLIFTGGMVVTDALNGWWIARLIDRADRVAAVASRVMGLAVAVVSLLVAAFALARQASAAFDAWAEHQGLVISIAVLAVLSGSYGVARLLAAVSNSGLDGRASSVKSHA